MSAVAAPAAVLPRPRTEFASEASRRRLRSVPAQAGPVARLELGNPLQLSKTMRARLLAAVRALVTSPALAGASDGARLASVVLTAKADVRKDFETSIWAAELGRWLGVSQSTVAHTVLPELRAAGFLGSNVATNAFGHATGLECWVIPMYRAQKAGDRRHPLALSRSELAVLLSLIEVLFGPGWAPKDKPVVPAGLLAGRTGRGAATDRLGLLLMVLTTGSAGWLQLCPGSVDTGRGRPAATVGRLLGCTAAAGAKVLKRLQEHGVAEVVRKETGSGLNAQSRVRLVPVAEAHGVAVREARRVAKSLISDLAGTASGDLESGETGETLVTTGVEGTGQDGMAGSADLAATAQHHALHASGVTPGGSLALSGGFSGEGRGGEGRRPERACVREDGGPLRGEQPKESPVIEGVNGGCGPVADGSVRVMDGAGQCRQQQGRGVLPPENLRVILEPVRLLWARLERPAARRLVEAAARAELTTVSGFVGRIDAPQVLADRLARRLEDQLRLGGPIVDPVGWLIGRGLPQRQQCGDTLCDDGMLLDSGRDCPRCEDRQVGRRAQRHAVAAAVDAAMPGASEAERRTAVEQQLHESVTARAWAKAREWEQVRARKAAAAQARAEAAAAQPADVVPAAPVAPVVLPAPRPAAVVPAPEPETADGDQELVLEDLTREQVRDWRVKAMKDHQVVFDHIDQYGETSARRLFSNQLVDQAQRLSGTRHLVLGHTAWGQA
ncbi:hypothetical protein [Streptomyces sp. ALI-76-A]|uniref:hypothetical protein n=1 Tax=Streptomyces sp. ALI-76-A TaxID=3025736 RepID=UPI00256F2575|nr:hypothetical protein [Streptomyces sp. ALI-76-A]MDL5206647.1 hypothetical protein [Streptomyces sp. ALI-76-A]